MAINLSTGLTSGGSGDAGDQYTGLDRFGRVIDQCWCKTTPASDKERVKYGFDRASNRQWRQNTVATALTKREDEFYTYDALNQVKSLARGKLNAGKTGLETPPPEPSWEEESNYDLTGNWYPTTMAYGYVTKENGNTTLQQNRTHNVANELATITNAGGCSQWPNPGYDAVGSFTTTPKPMAPEASFGLKWDAWNRMVEVTTGGNFVARWAYDGSHRRLSQLNGEECRHYFYSDQWQVLEERTGDNASAERRFIWGMRGVDDLVCRDRGGERLYALNDPANVTAIVDVVGAVKERYRYSGFGVPRYMDADFESRSTSDYDWETLFGQYRYDAKTGLYLPRERILHARLGRWLSRDPIGYRAGTNLYGGMGNGPMNRLDPFGLAAPPTDIAAFIEKYAQEHGGEQPWVGWWDTHQTRAFMGWYRGDDAERYGLVFNPNWANLNAPAPPEGTKPWVEPKTEKGWADYVPDRYDLGNFFAGAADVLSLSITRRIRDYYPEFYEQDYESGLYRGGQIAGTALGFALPGGGAARFAGGANRVLLGTARSGIYRFTGRTGSYYVGQSGNIARRLGQHLRRQRLAPGGRTTTWEVVGGKFARERAEQQLINRYRLRNINLENVVNPLGGRWSQYYYVPTVGTASGVSAGVGAGVGGVFWGAP